MATAAAGGGRRAQPVPLEDVAALPADNPRLLIVGVMLAAVIWFTADVSKFEPWAQIVYIALFVLGPLLWTAVGLAIGRALRRAGVPRRRAG